MVHQRSPQALKQRHLKFLSKFYPDPSNRRIKIQTASKAGTGHAQRTISLKGGRCEMCGFAKPQVLQIHHINGNHEDNRWENIGVLCANCHLLVHRGVKRYWDVLSRRK